MSHFRKREILEKIKMVLGDITTRHGTLKSEYVQEFIQFIINESNLLQLATVVQMDSPRKQISEVDDELQIDSVEEVCPSSKELVVKYFKGELSLDSYGIDEEIINLTFFQRSELRKALFSNIAKFIYWDIEDIVLNGDTMSVDPYLATFDGVLKQSDKNIVDAQGENIDTKLLHGMTKALPADFLKNRKSLRFLIGDNAEYDYRSKLEEFSTDFFGCSGSLGTLAVSAFGIRMEKIEAIQESLGKDCCKTVIMLCNPKNIHVGIWRKIRLELVRDDLGDGFNIVTTLYFDAKQACACGAVKAVNVQL